MTPKRLLLSTTAAAVALGGLAAGPAAADTVSVADASAQNVTAYGSTSAWSRKAADGYHLVISSGGVVADAPGVPVSSAPYDPDLGPTSANGRTVVYARGGDLYRFDVGSTGETKLRSSSSANETAPSFFKDTLVFSRTNGKAPGTYIARPGKLVKRLYKTVAVETDVAATRVIGRYGTGSKSIIRILNYSASDVKIVARAKAGQTVGSPTLTRFNGFWLRRSASDASVEQVGVNAHRGLDVNVSDRKLPGPVSSLASDGKIPTLYTSAAGVSKINPKLRFSS